MVVASSFIATKLDHATQCQTAIESVYSPVFDALRDKSEHLQEIPTQIQLQSTFIR
jgi:hypothetical protein